MPTAVYVLTAAPDGYASLALDNEEVLALGLLRYPSHDPGRWQQPLARVLPSPLGTTDLPDHPYLLAWLPCLSPRAADALTPVLDGHGRLWPLLTPAGRYYCYQVRMEIEALDETASSFMRFPDGKVFLITSHVFREEAIHDATIFRMPYKHGSATYVTESLVRAVGSAGLTGFKFHQVWDGTRPVNGPGGGW